MVIRTIFSPDLSIKFSNFHTIFYKIYHSHSIPKGTPARAMTSKTYDWGLRKKDSQNLSKIGQITIN